MDDLKDILLDSEEVLWAGKPGWESEKGNNSYLSRLLRLAGIRTNHNAYRFRDRMYAVTNKRLLVLRDEGELISADWSKLQAYDVRMVGKTSEITLSFENQAPNFQRITLHALPSMKEFESLIFHTHPNGVQK